MTNKKSLIGRRYIARGVKAVDLILRQEVELGTNHPYTIITDPYVFKYCPMPILGWALHNVKMMVVNVLDDRTGLAYAVKYNPANLVCDDLPTCRPETPVDFATSVEQIATELKVVFDSAGGGISDKCGIALFAISDDGNDKTSTSMCFLGGKGKRIIEAIASACSKNPQTFEFVKRASIEAMLHQIFDGDNKKK